MMMVVVTIVMTSLGRKTLVERASSTGFCESDDEEDGDAAEADL